jgi:hypothetical protein
LHGKEKKKKKGLPLFFEIIKNEMRKEMEVKEFKGVIIIPPFL